MIWWLSHSGADRKQHQVWHPVDELLFGLIVDQAERPASALEKLESLQVPPILDFDPVKSPSGGLELLDALPRQFVQPVPVRLFRLKLNRNIEITQPINSRSKVAS